jgi:hypothetical protein
LKRVRKLIDDRIEVLTSLNQRVDQCLNRQMENGSSLCHKRFEEQVTNQIRLWRIHASKIDNLLGVSLKSALASILPTGNDQHIDQVIELLVSRGDRGYAGHGAKMYREVLICTICFKMLK